MAEVSRKELPNVSKTRKSRNESIRSALGIYLRQRSYLAAEKFRKSDLVLTQTTKQFIFNKMIEGDLSRVNSVLYSNILCLPNNFTTAEQQFEKFVNFINSQRDYIKNELSNLFGPLICHLYIELLKGKEWKFACEFLRNYAYLVAPVENLNAPLPHKVNGCSVNSNYHEDPSIPTATTQIVFSTGSTGDPVKDHFKELIQTLSTCLRAESFDAIEAVVLFRSSKYELEFSIASINALRRYLDKHGHIFILNILHIWIHFDIKDLKDDNEESIFVLEEEVDRQPVLENGIDHKLEIKKEKETKVRSEVKCEDDSRVSPDKILKKSTNLHLKRLRHSAAKIQKLDIPTRVFKISDPDKMLTSAVIDSQGCHLVAGFDTSVVKLWQLNQSTHRGRNLYENVHCKLCNWNINTPCLEEENSSDEEEYKKYDTVTFTPIPNKRKRDELFMQQKYEGNSFNDSGGVYLRGHSKGITDVMFSSHYPILLTTSKDLTMRAWKASNYTCGAVYRGHNYPIWCVCESPVGMYLATGSRDFTARLWSIDRGFPLITYVGHAQDVQCVAFHPNGNYLATGSCDLSVRLWSVTSGKLFRVFTECKFPVTSISFSPDGKFLAAAGEETKIRIFDLAAGSQISELRDHTSPVTSIAWNRTGSKFASSCTDGSIRMWDVAKIGITDSQTPSSSTSSTSTNNKLLGHLSGCNRTIRIAFNSTDTISCIGVLNSVTVGMLLHFETQMIYIFEFQPIVISD